MHPAHRFPISPRRACAAVVLLLLLLAALDAHAVPLDTLSIGSITTTGASVSITTPLGTPNEQSICYGASSGPASSGTNCSVGTPRTLTGLSSGTTYHVQARYRTSTTTSGSCDDGFSSNASECAGNFGQWTAGSTTWSGYSYGSDNTFATLAATPPTLTTTAASAVTGTTAASGGNVTSQGSASVTARGVCWSTSANPAVGGNCTSNGTGTGSFSGSLTGLSASTAYHVRAYATNSVGTAYGQDLTFTTDHTITATAGPGGAISPAGATGVDDQGSQAYAITPSAGYRILDVLADSVSVGAVTSHTFSTVTAGHTISATFKKTWSLTASAGTGGTVTPGTSTVDDGSTVAIAPAAGYRILDVAVNSVSQGAVSSVTMDADKTIAATFLPVWTVTRTYDASKGSITGSATADGGASPAYTVSPAAGYRIGSVTVGGAPQTVADPYSAYTATVSAIGADTTVAATFVKIWSVAVSSSGGGTVSPGSGVADDGTSPAYAFTPAAGQRVVDVRVDGASVGAPGFHAFPSIAASHTLAVAFGPASRTITASAGTGGTISPAGPTTVADGASQAFTVASAAGYALKDLIVDGTSMGPMTSYVFQNVATDHTVAASFEPWSAPVPGGASVTPTTSAQTTQSGTGASLSIPAATVSATGASQATWSFGDGRSSTSAAAAPVSHDYDLAGAFTVLCTLTDANGATVATTTDTVTVTSGRIEVSPLQSEATARIQKATETLRDVSAADLRTLYGVADQSIQPLKKASDFVATIDQPLKPAVFRFSIYDLPLETAKLRLLKLKADGTNKEYAYASSASNDRDGRWWISDEAGYDIPITDTLAPATRYYVHFVILDNGPFDADPAPGAIHDPVTLAQSDTAASADAPSGGSGGCTAAPADQGLDLALLLLTGAGLAAMGRRLARAAVPSGGPRRRVRRP